MTKKIVTNWQYLIFFNLILFSIIVFLSILFFGANQFIWLLTSTGKLFTGICCYRKKRLSVSCSSLMLCNTITLKTFLLSCRNICLQLELDHIWSRGIHILMSKRNLQQDSYLWRIIKKIIFHIQSCINVVFQEKIYQYVIVDSVHIKHLF